MDYNWTDLKEIHQRKSTFIIKYGPHDIVSDIESLLSEVSTARTNEETLGYMTPEKQEQVEALRHLAIRRTIGHEYQPNSCSQCRAAQRCMERFVKEHNEGF